MKKRFISIALSTTLLLNFSCKTCDDALHLADLAYSLALVTIPEVAILVDLPLKTIIKNFAPVCKENPATGSANATNQSIRATYRPTANNAWQDTQINGNSYVVDPIKSLNPDEEEARQTGFRFTKPGIYHFELQADYNGLVSESNENNNFAGSNNNGTVKAKMNSAFQLTVVVTDPTGKIQPNYDPNVKVDIIYLGGKTIQ